MKKEYNPAKLPLSSFVQSYVQTQNMYCVQI